MFVYKIGDKLTQVNRYQFPPASAPRHLVFADDQRLNLNLELGNKVASMKFDAETSALSMLDSVSAVRGNYKGYNEPAEIRLHPNHRFLYVNNRGADDIAVFSIGDKGKLSFVSSAPLAKSLNPGVAARSFTLPAEVKQLIAADRPANAVKIFDVNSENGTLTLTSETNIPQPAFISLIPP